MGNQASSVNIESVVKDIFECPVCYEKFSGEIVQCTAGHAVCGNCVKRLENCPVCHKPIRGTRNFCMEEIVKELERLGISIEDAIEKIVCKNPTPSKSASQFATPVTTSEIDNFQTSANALNPMASLDTVMDLSVMLSEDDFLHNLRSFPIPSHELEDTISADSQSRANNAQGSAPINIRKPGNNEDDDLETALRLSRIEY